MCDLRGGCSVASFHFVLFFQCGESGVSTLVSLIPLISPSVRPSIHPMFQPRSFLTIA